MRLLGATAASEYSKLWQSINNGARKWNKKRVQKKYENWQDIRFSSISGGRASQGKTISVIEGEENPTKSSHLGIKKCSVMQFPNGSYPSGNFAKIV